MDNIFKYISDYLYMPNSARDLIKKINKSIDDLKDIPKAYRVIHKHAELEMEYRRLIVQNYAIIYTIEESEQKVYIIHVYYRKRDYLNKL